MLGEGNVSALVQEFSLQLIHFTNCFLQTELGKKLFISALEEWIKIKTNSVIQSILSINKS